MRDSKEFTPEAYRLPALFLIARVILILSLPLQGVKSYGDFWNFYRLAGLGRPFLDIWVEFPPLFPFLSRGIYHLVGAREHAYIYLSVILFSLIQAGSLYLFQQIAAEIWGKEIGLRKAILYGFFIVGLFYSWAYFDCLAVFLTLLGLLLTLRSNLISSGVVLGLGGLVKWFPILVLPAIWKKIGAKKAFRVILSVLLIVLLVWGALYIISPELTKASLVSQGIKGSWESIWAILDGNQQTGNFDPTVDRFNPDSASMPGSNPARIPPWVTLLVFAGIGLYLFYRADIQSSKHLIAFSGLTLIIFFLWSPGYSPQWVLYILPLVLLCFEEFRSALLGVIILLVNLLEWPLLLSRGLFQHLTELIILRSVIYVILALLFVQILFTKRKKEEKEMR